MKDTGRKLIVLVLTSMLTLSLAACGNSDNTKRNPSKHTTKTTRVSSGKKVKYIKKNTNAATVTVNRSKNN